MFKSSLITAFELTVCSFQISYRESFCDQGTSCLIRPRRDDTSDTLRWIWSRWFLFCLAGISAEQLSNIEL